MKPTFLSRLLISIGLAAALLALLFLFGGVHPADVLSTLLALPPGVYLAALGLHGLTYGLRALRFVLLIPQGVRPRFLRALPVAAAHNMASYLLPFKAGEASLVLYLRLHCGTPAAAALASLLVSRFLDAAALCLGLAVACFALRESGAALAWLGPTSAGLVAGTLLFALLAVRGDLLVRGLEHGLRWLRVHHLRLGQRMLGRMNELALALRAASGHRRLAGAALATVPMWFSVFGFYALLARALGIPAGYSFLDRAFGASLATLFNLLPVNAAAGMGTQELGWVTGFHVVLGVEEKLALTSGLGVHLVQLFNIVLMGVCSHVVMGIRPRWRFSEEPAPAGPERPGRAS